MKKIIVFLSIIIVLFAELAIVSNIQKQQKVQGNPFGKDTLHAATVQQLNDPIYQNIILPDELEQAVNNEDEVIVYFYSPTCPACKQASPIIVPLSEELGFDMKLYNLLEFEEGWQRYRLTVTPTIVRFQNGVETDRIEGLATESEYRAWFSN